jgi:hypothetical protein
MKKYFFILVLSSFLFSCQNKTKSLLVKKWDCVQIENLAPMDKHFVTTEDSLNTVKIEAALKTLVWTFNSNNTYNCSTGTINTVQGNYQISSDEKTLTLVPVSQNTINTYLITAISDYELVLTSTGTAVPIIMHFRQH